MSQSQVVIDFPVKAPADAKALAEELPPLMADFAQRAGRSWYRAFLPFYGRGRRAASLPVGH